MLYLHLLRHSNAADLPPAGSREDSDRRLTPDGRLKARQIGKALEHLGLVFDLILSSPAVRTRQTAELVSEGWNPRPPMEFDDDLRIGRDSFQAIRRIKSRGRGDRSVLVVGHEPELSRLASRLLTGTPDLDIVFKKGSACRLAIRRVTEGPCASLEWLLSPGPLRRLGGSRRPSGA
jgi:phosphohistidine phosphatase